MVAWKKSKSAKEVHSALGQIPITEGITAIVQRKEQTMSDLIKREDAIKAIFSKPACHGSDGSWYHSDDIRDAINSTPSADRPQGEWIYPTDIIGFGRCNNCKALWDKSLIDNIYFKYCPRCGARMKGEDDE